ncbi:flagellar export chaperone FliS [Labrys wisconsinensis]|uniref:Flagellar protein FliS n=1 Tax=Labrys wisconsinensis TaxID=425677 RepID=A0ABU0J8V9_9HYPH|nr:flagellar export chaperone FliS [Labrys wisconsinensis]MDQ0470708.1 flagellar protein FliS [Labrys wisconsinensis]
MTPSHSQAAIAYRQAASTVSPTMAVVRLYDKVILLTTQAVAAMEARRIEESHKLITRASNILKGLRGCIDSRRGGALAEQLSRMYTAQIVALHSSFGTPDAPERYRKLLVGLRDLREAWAVVAQKVNGGA